MQQQVPEYGHDGQVVQHGILIGLLPTGLPIL